MSGTGFTFSAVGAGSVTIAPSGSDTLDLAPVTLRQYDRYHVISDGSSLWREIFKTNSVSPHFSGPPVMPSYPVTALPSSVSAGAIAFASNGRKPGDLAGKGSGVQVFYDGSQWISACSGALVTV